MFSAGGPSTFEFDITINDDDDFESFHSFSISFDSSVISSGGTNSTTVIVISDRDGRWLLRYISISKKPCMSVYILVKHIDLHAFNAYVLRCIVTIINCPWPRDFALVFGGLLP